MMRLEESGDAWSPRLGPSRELHADYYGKRGPAIEWPEFRRRYLAEMKEQREAIAALAARVLAGEPIGVGDRGDHPSRRVDSPRPPT